MTGTVAKKVLLAEDEMIVAFDLSETVKEAGFEVDGPHTNVSSTMLAFQVERPDLAILDINLDDGNVFQLAEMLEAEHVPLIFHSGRYSKSDIEAKFPGARVLTKPTPPTEILQAMNDLLSEGTVANP